MKTTVFIVCRLQEEFDDEDDWNPYKAAGVCMMLLATCCEDDIVPHVLPFVKDNIKHEDWRHRCLVCWPLLVPNECCGASSVLTGSGLSNQNLNLKKKFFIYFIKNNSVKSY